MNSHQQQQMEIEMAIRSIFSGIDSVRDQLGKLSRSNIGYLLDARREIDCLISQAREIEQSRLQAAE